MKRLNSALLSLLVVVGASLVASPGAHAAKQSVIKNTVNELSCAFETAEDDLIFFNASAVSDDSSSGSGAVVENETGPILFGEDGTATFGPEFAADMTMVGLDGVPVGVLSVRLAITTPDPAVVEQLNEVDGNVKTTGTVTTTDFAISVTSVTLPGYTVLPGADDCTGSEIIFDVRSNNPSRQVRHYNDFGSPRCALAGFPNARLEELSGQSKNRPLFVVAVDDGVNPLKASGELAMKGGNKVLTGTTTVPLTEISTDETVADLTIELTLTRVGQQMSQKVSEDGLTAFVRWTLFDAAITVTTTDGRSGTTTCPATFVTVSEKYSRG